MKQEEVLRIQEEVQAKDDETRRLQDEVVEARRRQEEVANALVNATTTPAHLNLRDVIDDDDEHVPNGHSHELDNGDMQHEDPVEGRTTQAEKNERLQNQLRVSYIIWPNISWTICIFLNSDLLFLFCRC